MFIKPDVFVNYKKNIIEYPKGDYFYNPSIYYPEYPFGESDISPIENSVYSIVRETLFGYGLDKEHYGTKKWNPFGDIIKKNDKVLVKPNWVIHFNKVSLDANNLDCLITHPSVVRAIVDYVYIALHNSGTILVADAPMQDCDIQMMFERSGYLMLFQFWKTHISNVIVKDLRKYSTVFNQGVVVEKKYTTNVDNAILVNLGDKSMHCEDRVVNNTQYKISDYSSKLTNAYHNGDEHIYEVNRAVLEADIVINVPKPKCHRLAGMTAGMKNLVGIIYEKASLPHRKLGDSQNGGDSYKNKSIFKNLMQICDEKKTIYNNEKNSMATIFSFFEKVTYLIGCIFSKDKIRVGGWYGNDTIWRTVVDLNMIVKYVDISGKIHNTPQRKILCIGDLIICGQKNGPVTPHPKALGMLMISESNMLFDTIMCKIMGFERKIIKSISNEKALNLLGYDMRNIDKSIVQMNEKKMEIKEFRAKNEWKFEPHEMWKGHIEKEDDYERSRLF